MPKMKNPLKFLEGFSLICLWITYFFFAAFFFFFFVAISNPPLLRDCLSNFVFILTCTIVYAKNILVFFTKELIKKHNFPTDNKCKLFFCEFDYKKYEIVDRNVICGVTM